MLMRYVTKLESVPIEFPIIETKSFLLIPMKHVLYLKAIDMLILLYA
jgi:hypothetical protein